MKLIQIGEAKSGNYWLYTILNNILTQGSLEQKSFIKAQSIYKIAKAWELSYDNQADIDVLDIGADGCFYRISSIFRMPIEDISEYISQTSHVWSHSPSHRESKNILKQFDKIVYIIRDPRDRAISAAKFRFTPYGLKFYSPAEPDPESWLENRFERLINRWVEHVGGYLEHANEQNIHVIFYERLLHSFDQEFSALLDYLELDLKAKAVEEIKQKVRFSSMHALNPGHVRKGKSGYWEDSLTDKQKRITVRFAAPMLKYLGYPLYNLNGKNNFPKIPQRINPSQVRNAVNHSYRAMKIHKMVNFVKR